MNKQYLVGLWIEHPVRAIDQLYTYTANQYVAQGTRVRVNFNRRDVIGFVEECVALEGSIEAKEKELGVELKQVLEVLDEEPLITPELHDLAMYMKEMTLSTTISCFQALLPAKVKPTSSKHQIVKEAWVILSDKEVDLTPKQLEASLYVKEHMPLKYSDLRKAFPNQAHVLIEKGAIQKEEKEKEASRTVHEAHIDKFPLTPLQEAAMKEIEESEDAVYLLHGVTGSGKTEIYLQLAEKELEKKRQVLFLVPEISLTPQMIARVSSRFGSELAIYHSGLNAQEKYEQYRKVKNGIAEIVVGTRSAVFLPFHDLGLIIVDEEQDGSYKQDTQPAYHCRDMAIYRGKYHHCKTILGSATPSLDSYARALKGRYHLVTLKERINETLPSITLVPLKDAIKKGESYILSDTLSKKMEERLEKHQQMILLLNRRGYHSLLRCNHCQEVIHCPHCDLAMSYHKSDKTMKCHTCGTSILVPKICPSCKQRVSFSTAGFGTEKLEQEVSKRFPHARVLRMDADTTTKKNSHETILKKFENQEADILLGTQMIAKGLDYPNVTLVGIINGDEGLNRTDYRSCETTFDLLMQASGRSGRAKEEGEVVIQVFEPDHYVVECAKNQNYQRFFEQEMKFRHDGQYPPYTYMISITIQNRNQHEADAIALSILHQLEGDYKKIGVIPLLKIRDLYRNRILLKGKNLEEMRTALGKLLETNTFKQKDIRIDVNPMGLDG